MLCRGWMSRRSLEYKNNLEKKVHSLEYDLEYSYEYNLEYSLDYS